MKLVKDYPQKNTMMLYGRDGRRLKVFGGKAVEFLEHPQPYQISTRGDFGPSQSGLEHSSTLFVKIEQTLNEVK